MSVNRLIERLGCRGGFGIMEIVAFLNAYPHPESEWTERVTKFFKDSSNG